MDTKLENQTTLQPRPALPKNSNRKQLIVGALLILGLAAYVLKDKLPLNPGAREAVSKVERVNSQAVLTVELTTVEPRDFERKLLVSGTVWAWDPVQVGSEVNGLKVQSVLVDDGDAAGFVGQHAQRGHLERLQLHLDLGHAGAEARILDHRQAADARTDQHTRAVTIFFRLRDPAGIFHGFLCGRQTVFDEAVDFLLFLDGNAIARKYRINNYSHTLHNGQRSSCRVYLSFHA